MRRRPTNGQLEILVANEPRAYRDMLANELPDLRPHLVVRAVEPAELDSAMARHQPGLVICSHLTKGLPGQCIATLLLYPAGQDCALIEITGVRQEIAHPRLRDLLAVIDQITSIRAA